MFKPSLVLLVSCFSLFLSATELKPLAEFGANPGELSATYLAPVPNNKNLLVVLHGCGQQAEQLATNSGLLKAAEKSGFALLLPQQSAANNPQLCFNWFSAEDTGKGQGEHASLMAMIAKVKEVTATENTYLVGMSAGGAMASALVVQQPEEFKAAAIIAGISYPCAHSLVGAIACMKSGPLRSIENSMQVLSSNKGHWPEMTIITGSADSIVAPVNSEYMVNLWREASGVVDSEVEGQGNARIMSFKNATKETVLHSVVIEGMSHGWPVKSGSTYAETTASFISDVGFSATEFLVGIWKLK